MDSDVELGKRLVARAIGELPTMGGRDVEGLQVSWRVLNAALNAGALDEFREHLSKVSGEENTPEQVCFELGFMIGFGWHRVFHTKQGRSERAIIEQLAEAVQRERAKARAARAN